MLPAVTSSSPASKRAAIESGPAPDGTHRAFSAVAIAGAGVSCAASEATSTSVSRISETHKPNAALYSAPLPTRDKDGHLCFPDNPRFRPNLTPAEVLQRGSFGGTYFRSIFSSVTKKRYEDAWKEFPSEWFDGMNIKTQIANPVYRPAINRHGVKCGQDLDAW